METKSTNEVKGDYDRVSASECLGSLIELHGIVMEDDLFVIPDADGTAVLYNDGKIRFDEIADIEVGSVFVGILLRNGYLFYLSVPNRSRRAYTRMAGGVQSLKFLPVALPDISGVNCTGSWATIRRSIDGKQKIGRLFVLHPKVGHFWGVFMKYNYEIRLKAVKLVLEGGLSVRKPDVTWAVAARKFTCG